MRVVLWWLTCLASIVAAGLCVPTLPDSPLGLFAIPVLMWFAVRCDRNAKDARQRAVRAREAAQRQREREEREAAREARRQAEIDAIDEAHLTRLFGGDLPRREPPQNRSLPADESMHFFASARSIWDGKTWSGELMVTNRGLYFTGERGHEVLWSRIQGVDMDEHDDTLVVRTTTARGTHRYRFTTLTDLMYAVGTVYGGLAVAQRLVTVGGEGERDSRRISQQIKAEVWRRDGGRCQECGSTSYLEFDHVIPWSLGGATSVNNLQLLCRGCNARKGNRI